MTMAELYSFVLTPMSTWSYTQMALFPWLFSVPAEMLALIADLIIAYMGDTLPMNRTKPNLSFTDNFYIYFNRIVMLPFVALLNIKVIFNSSAVVYDYDQFTFFNTVVAFIIVFSLSDLVYYTGHRIVHSIPPLYAFVHKHHHGEAEPRRGWADTCNAHPTDFFYTGISTSPMSTLWIMPAGSVHIVTIAAMMYVNMFVGALGHTRIDLNLFFFNTRFHAGHHSTSRHNYAQNIELWDRLFGTYTDLPGMEKADKARALAGKGKVATN